MLLIEAGGNKGWYGTWLVDCSLYLLDSSPHDIPEIFDRLCEAHSQANPGAYISEVSTDAK
jgi:hypothetical protein